MTPPPALPKPAPHPLLEFPSDTEIAALAEHPEGAEIYLATYQQHAELVAAAEWDEAKPLAVDMLRHGFELPHWAETDTLLGLKPAGPETAAHLVHNWRKAPYVQTFTPALREELGALPEPLLQQSFYIWIGLGGNRSGKSEYCAKRVVQSALKFPSGLVVCLAETLEASIVTQQALIWKYLPPEIKKLNNKRDPNGIFNVTYTKKNGFTGPSVILPNGTQILFKSYGSEPGDVEGWMLGSRYGRAVGMWLDESATAGWFEAGKRRCRYCGAILLWSFTPIKGMTPAIKEAVGEAETVKALPAELLPQDTIHVVGCAPGWMPYLQLPRTPGAVVQYFFSQFNPFGTAAGPLYDAVKSLCVNDDGTPKASPHIKRIAYGYTEDTTGRRFPMYCAVHNVKVKNLPRVGSIYQYNDPHGSRPYATIWVLVTPGPKPDYYIVRDWPDERTYGEWAVTTTRETSEETRKGWDGDKGPAQRAIGWGVVHYKKLWMDTERVRVPKPMLDFLEEASGPVMNDPRWLELLETKVKYPWHRALIQRALVKRRPLDELREEVIERSMDSRFCNAEHAAEFGGTCLKWLFEEEQRDGKGNLVAPSMPISEASGKDLEHGYGLVADLLAFEKEQPLVPGINAPRLYISEECTQMRWAVENFTGRSGQEGACKEWIDLLRHLAEASPMHVDTSGFKTLHRVGSHG